MNLPKLTAEQSLGAAEGVYINKVVPGVSDWLGVTAVVTAADPGDCECDYDDHTEGCYLIKNDCNPGFYADCYLPYLNPFFDDPPECGCGCFPILDER